MCLLGAACEDEPYDRRCDFIADGDGIPSDLIAFSRPAGLFEDPFELTVTSSVPGTLRYTTNGCPPDRDSKRLDGPLEIEESTEVRVALFDGDQPTPPRATAAYLHAPGGLDFDSNLPVVVVETWAQELIDEPEGSRPHRPAYMLVFEPDGSGRTSLDDQPVFAGRIGVHIRGNSTAEEYPKKQYKIETWTEFDDDLDVELLGMPAESDWVFHAPHSDKTFMRNHLMYTWSNRVGRYASRTRFVEGFIDWDDELGDDDYEGLYVWMEKIKVGPDRVAVAKLDDNDYELPQISGGYLLARDWESEDYGFETETYEDLIHIEYPRREKINDRQEDYIIGYVDDFEAALAGPDFAGPEGYEAFIDVDAFIDHHLLVEMGRSVDGFVLSTYMSKDRGGKLAMGPIWDFNGALGNADYFEAWEPEGWHHDVDGFPFDNPHGYRWYDRLFEDPGFRARYAARWQELRAGPLTDEVMLGDIAEAEDLVSEAAARNFARWDILGEYVWPNDEGHEDRDSYAEEVEYLRWWIQARTAWMDAELQ